MRSIASRRVVCASLILCLLGLGPGRSGAGEGLETVVTVFAEHDHLGLFGSTRTYFPGDHPVTVTRDFEDPEEIIVRVHGEHVDDTWELSFAPPRGGTLAEGTYEHTVSIGERTEERAGFDISGDGWGCPQEGEGRFTVKRLVTEAGGAITSLGIVYEHRCMEKPPKAFGEVRYNVPGDGGAAIVSSRNLSFGDVDYRQFMKLVPVRVMNPTSQPLAVGDVGIEGPQAGSFKANGSGCQNITLLPGERCTIWLRFLAAERGTNTAALKVAEASGFVHESALSGFVHGGTTRFVLSSHPDDLIGDGRFYDFKPSGARFQITGNARRVDFSVRGYQEGIGESWWDVTAMAPPGEVLEIGRRYVNTPDPPHPADPNGWGFDVGGDHRGCMESKDSFTITEFEIGPYGTIEEFGMSFVQRCGGIPLRSGPLRGILDYRVEQSHDPPPPPPPFHDRRFDAYSNNGRVSGGVSEYDESPDVCWDRVPIQIYDVTKWPYELMETVRTNHRGGFRWPDPRHDLLLVLPVKWLKNGWVCSKVLVWVND